MNTADLEFLGFEMLQFILIVKKTKQTQSDSVKNSYF